MGHFGESVGLFYYFFYLTNFAAHFQQFLLKMLIHKLSYS